MISEEFSITLKEFLDSAKNFLIEKEIFKLFDTLISALAKLEAHGINALKITAS